VGTPHSILGIRDSSDPVQLRRQKFDWMMIKTNLCTPAARFVYTGSETPPSWISPVPKVFFDRREMKWVKVWDFDPSKLVTYGNTDSIFYLDDVTNTLEGTHTDHPTNQVINAFRIINANVLPRNMTIACGKPVYIRGDFNSQDGTGDTSNYRNAQIASDAITVLSNQWDGWKAANITGSFHATSSSMEQPYSNSSWISCLNCSAARVVGYTGNMPSSDVRINAAMITGNTPSPTSCLSSTTEAAFEACYEGGWHNTLRFLEPWTNGQTVRFYGSFVCLWTAQSVRLPSGSQIINSGYYTPPTRSWGFDPRFSNLNNMPPGAPFLATAILTNWLERN